MRLAGVPVKGVLVELNLKNHSRLKRRTKCFREGEHHRLHQPTKKYLKYNFECSKVKYFMLENSK